VKEDETLNGQQKEVGVAEAQVCGEWLLDMKLGFDCKEPLCPEKTH